MYMYRAKFDLGNALSSIAFPLEPNYENTVKGEIFAVVLISLCSRSTIFPRN